MMIIRLLLLSLLSLLASSLASAAPRPNILVVLTDDMGYGDLKAYNPESKIETPAIDRIAREGMRFTDAHTTGSTCIPARFGLLTGTFPWRMPNMNDSKPLIPEDMPTVASILKGAGYETAMVGKWHLGFVDKKNPKEGQPLVGGPMDRGFESFFGIHASTDIPPYYYIDGRLPLGLPMKQIAANNDNEKATGWNNIQGAFWRAGGIGQDLDLEKVTPVFFDRAVAFLEREHEKPFFLYLALPSPHTPWLPTEEFKGKSKAGSYGDFVMTVDHGIGRLLTALDETQLAKDTLVLVTNDNGPVWLGKDEKEYDHLGSGPLRGMKGDNWEGGHRVPFLVRWPGKVAAGSTNRDLISFVDVAATFADLAGANDQHPADSMTFGLSLVGKENPIPRKTIVHGRKGKYSLRDGDWKLLLHKGSAGFSRREGDEDAKSPPGQLYNLEDDLGESTNLWNEQPERVAELTKKLNAILGKK